MIGYIAVSIVFFGLISFVFMAIQSTNELTK